MMTDPIADLLTRIRNASKAKKNAVDIPASGVKREIVRILKEHKLVNDLVELPDSKQGILRVYLRYNRQDEPVIKGLVRMSKPGLRQYMNSDDIKATIHNMRGLMIVSTSQGVMTNFDAAQKGIGGEMLCRCW